MSASPALLPPPDALAAWARALWDALGAALADENNADTQALVGCGEEHLRALRGALHDRDGDALDALVATAHACMAEAHRAAQPTLPWRRLYTDACILRSLVDVLEDRPEADIVDAVARLDKAVIVAGPAGEGRLELILEFVARLQAALPPALADPSPSHTFASTPFSPPPHPATSPTPIPRLRTPPSLASFLATHAHAPFILPRFARDWPALATHSWASPAYLRAAAGPARVVPVEVGRDYRADDWAPAFAGWDAFLDGLAAASAGAHGDVLYLAQHDLLKQFPALRDDVVVPDYAYAAPRAPAEYPDYRPPANEEQLVVNVWFGPAGTVSPAHTDPFFNLYTQVVGHKTVWLAPPHASPHMHAYSPSSSSPSDAQQHNPAANTTAPLLSNTSALDVFASPAALPAEFVARVVPHAVGATLAPGDVLFFPPGWWHAMRAEQTSFSVSMWF
ncbi:hypothetical protein PsYK624_143260 [Phanerochaete sordida]|uniref:JmjC domain-containing protein n=1 Tax=Phanerochaete sordida TaxID=48140 RepID=A0A9P3GRJ7_9APHY|nr:hypothetical protein PsYK624_143260 [Phanerochaete sordida]